MLTNAQKVRLAVFFILGLAFLVSIGFIVAGQLILNPTVTYYVEFRGTSVAGLSQGTPVRYNGIEVGTVRDVSFAEGSVERVIATISVRRDVPIKEDAKVQLRPVGIAGGQQVAFYGASDAADRLPPETTIQAQQSTLEQVTEPAQDIVQRVSAVVNDLNKVLGPENRQKLEAVLTHAAGILRENRGDIRDIVRNTERIVSQSGAPLAEASADIRAAAKDLAVVTEQLKQTGNTLLDSGQTDRLVRILDTIEQTVEQTQESIGYVETMTRDSETRLMDTLRTLEDTVDYLNNFAIQISEDPSRLVR